jgi:UDPglucose 6-dehydrogenase
MCLESAELAKIAINMFLASTLTTTNVLAEMCEAIGADWDEIVPSLRLDKRIGPHAYLKPGLGIGGTNLLRDMVTIRTIAEERGTDAGPVDAWLKNSRWRRDWALRAVHREVLCRTPAATVAVWGVAYKENTASTRNSPGAELVTALKGYRRQVYDPAATLALPGDCDVIQSSGPIEACRGADVLLVMTPWPELAGIDPATIRAAMRGRTVIDPFGLLPAGPVAAAGLTHFRQGTACH